MISFLDLMLNNNILFFSVLKILQMMDAKFKIKIC